MVILAAQTGCAIHLLLPICQPYTPLTSPSPSRGRRRGSVIQVVIVAGFHLFPFRTEKLSPPAPMVLHTRGRVGSRRFFIRKPFERNLGGLPLVYGDNVLYGKKANETYLPYRCSANGPMFFCQCFIKLRIMHPQTFAKNKVYLF